MHFMNKHGVCVFLCKSTVYVLSVPQLESIIEKELYMCGQFSNWEVSLKTHYIDTVVFIIGKCNEKHCVGMVGP